MAFSQRLRGGGILIQWWQASEVLGTIWHLCIQIFRNFEQVGFGSDLVHYMPHVFRLDSWHLGTIAYHRNVGGLGSAQTSFGSPNWTQLWEVKSTGQLGHFGIFGFRYLGMLSKWASGRTLGVHCKTLGMLVGCAQLRLILTCPTELKLIDQLNWTVLSPMDLFAIVQSSSRSNGHLFSLFVCLSFVKRVDALFRDWILVKYECLVFPVLIAIRLCRSVFLVILACL